MGDGSVGRAAAAKVKLPLAAVSHGFDTRPLTKAYCCERATKSLIAPVHPAVIGYWRSARESSRMGVAPLPANGCSAVHRQHRKHTARHVTAAAAPVQLCILLVSAACRKQNVIIYIYSLFFQLYATELWF